MAGKDRSHADFWYSGTGGTRLHTYLLASTFEGSCRMLLTRFIRCAIPNVWHAGAGHLPPRIIHLFPTRHAWCLAYVVPQIDFIFVFHRHLHHHLCIIISFTMSRRAVTPVKRSSSSSTSGSAIPYEVIARIVNLSVVAQLPSLHRSIAGGCVFTSLSAAAPIPTREPIAGRQRS